MIQRNNNLSVLPFYENIDEQAHRRTYAYGDIYPLYAPLGGVPSFQLVFPHDTSDGPSAWQLRRSDGTLVGVVNSALTQGGLQRINYTDYDIVLYPALAPQAITPKEGRYYLEAHFTKGRIMYSDVFTVVGDMSDFLMMQWWDTEDLVMDGERIAYKSGANIVYRNTLWLNTQLGKPDYEFEEQGEQRDGLYFPEKMISFKRYKFNILANEPLCDVMRFIRLSDFVFVRDKYGNVYRCDTFLMTPKWETQGNIASIDVEFTCNTVAKKIAHGYAGLGEQGDFNNDYNNDFDNLINN